MWDLILLVMGALFGWIAGLFLHEFNKTGKAGDEVDKACLNAYHKLVYYCLKPTGELYKEFDEAHVSFQEKLVSELHKFPLSRQEFYKGILDKTLILSVEIRDYNPPEIITDNNSISIRQSSHDKFRGDIEEIHRYIIENITGKKSKFLVKFIWWLNKWI